MIITQGEDGEVTVIGKRYGQQPLSGLGPLPNGDPCYWCSAYGNMPLCDVLSPHCKFDHVFIRRRR